MTGAASVYVGLGANLDHPVFGSPRRTLMRALAMLPTIGARCVALSGWYRSAPVPASDQPWYVNAVAEVATGLGPEALLAGLHRVEDRLGRVRREPNAPRWVDLDLLAYGDEIRDGSVRLPHPRLDSRAFVLLPLADLAPGWSHPVTGETIARLIARLPPGQDIERLA